MGKNYSSADYMDALARKFNHALDVPTPTSNALRPPDIASDLPLSKKENPIISGGRRVIDILSRGDYAVGQKLQNIRDVSEGPNGNFTGDSPTDILNTAKAMAKPDAVPNLFVNDKILPSEPILHNWEPTSLGGKIGKGAASLALDIGLDPLTYVPGAAIVGVGKKIAKITGLGKEGVNVALKAKPLGEEIKAATETAPAVENAAPDLLGIGGRADDAHQIPGRIPESHQLPEAPRQFEMPEGPRTFNMPASPRVFAGEGRVLPESRQLAGTGSFAEGVINAPKVVTKATKAAEKKAAALAAKTAKTEAAAQSGKLVPTIEHGSLFNPKTGTTQKWSARLAQMFKEEPVYKNLDIEAPFEARPVAHIEDAMAGTVDVADDGFNAWVKASGKMVAPGQTDTGRMTIAETMAPVTSGMATSAQATSIQARLRAGYDAMQSTAIEKLKAAPAKEFVPEAVNFSSPEEWATANRDRIVHVDGNKISWGKQGGDQPWKSVPKGKAMPLSEAFAKHKPLVAALYTEEKRIATDIVTKGNKTTEAALKKKALATHEWNAKHGFAELLQKAGVDKESKAARTAVTGAARQAGLDVPVLHGPEARLVGPELEAWKANLLAQVGPGADYTKLLRAKTSASFEKTLSEMKSRTSQVPVYIEQAMTIDKASIEANIAESIAETADNIPAAVTPIAPEVVEAVVKPEVVIPKKSAAPVGSKENPARTPKGYKKPQLVVDNQAVKDQGAILEALSTVDPAVVRITSMEPLPSDIAMGGGLDEAAHLGLKEAAKQQRWANSPLPDTDMPFVSGISEAQRSSATLRQGIGIHRESANAHFQYNLFNSIIGYWDGKIPRLPDGKRSLTGYARAEWLYQRVIPSLRASEEFLHAKGIQPIASSLKEGYPMGLSDVLTAMYEGTSGAVVKGRVFDLFGISKPLTKAEKAAGIIKTKTAGKVEITNLLEAVNLITQRLGRATSIKDAKELRIALDDLLKPIDGLPSLEVAVEKKLLSGRGITTGSRGAQVTAREAATVVTQVSDTLLRPEVLSKMFNASMANTARYAVEFNAEVKALSESSLKQVLDVITDPMFTPGERIHVLANTKKIVQGEAKVQGSSAAATQAAIDAVDSGLTGARTFDDMSSAALRTNLSETIELTNLTPMVRAERVQRASQAVYNADVAARISKLSQVDKLNTATVSEAAMETGIFRKMHPVLEGLGEKLNAAWRNPTLRPAVVRAKNLASVVQNGWRHELNIVNRNFSKEQTVAAIRWLQSGEDIAIAPKEIQGAVMGLKPTFGQIFEHSFDANGKRIDGVLPAFFREGFDVNHINEKLAFAYRGNKTGVEVPQFIPKVRKVNGKSETYIDAEVMSQWKDWKIKDPIDFLGRMEHAFSGLATDMGVAQEGWRIASSLGYASKVQRKGMIQFEGQASSMFGRYMPKGAWFDPDILPEIMRMDAIASESSQLGGTFGKFVNTYIDPIVNMWKAGVTIWNPGHHVRNFSGDTMLSYYANGVVNPKYTHQALQMMTLRGEYDGWSALQALQGIEKATGTAPARNLMINVLINGKMTKVSDREIHRGIMSRGFSGDFRVQEDLLESGMSNPAIERMQRRMMLNGGKTKQAIGQISEAREDTVRIAHLLHLLENGDSINPLLTKSKGYASLDEALDSAVKQVRRYHPDGSDLSNFESKVMRRIFPFYSWTRKALPLIAETMVTQPGRFMVYPKASYDFAKQMGVEGNSLSDPFPDDQPMPSWMTEEATGPLWKNEAGKYFGIDPGVPGMDILNQFGSSPNKTKQETLGMVTPALKIPIEAMTKTNLGIGSPINDTTDYIDAQIPGVSKLSSSSGYSVTGSLLGMLTGRGLDPQYQMTKGNKGSFDPEAFVNYLSGMGMQNMSKQSAINSANIEKRNAATQAAKDRKAAAARNGGY